MNSFINNIYRHRYDLFFSLLLVILVGLFCFIIPKNETVNVLRTMENKTFDIRQNIIAKNKSVNKDIVIVTVDDPSYEYLLETYGDWPIPRSVYAKMLDYIQAQKPKYVAFDLLFIKNLKRIPKSDDALIEGFRKYKNTFTAINFDDYSSELRVPPILSENIKTNININSDNINIYKFPNCRTILPELIEVTQNIGHINTPKEDDGFLRTIPLVVNYPQMNKDNYYLYMTLKLAIDYLNKYENANIKEIKIDKNNNLILGKRQIPLTENAEVILNWYGPSGLESDKTFKYVSFWEVLKSIEAKENGKKQLIENDFFKNKIVYIGTNIFSLSDIKTVPTSKYFPGVEIHATLLNNIIDNNLIKKANIKYNILICLILMILASYTAFKIRSVYISVILFTILNGAYLYYSTYIMDKYNIWVWNVIPLILTVFIFVCSYIIKYLIKSRDFEYTYKLATTDGLTELYNHRYFQEKMSEKVKLSEKNNSQFSLIMIDIDYFKKFNDKYGHQAGDAVLKYVASTLKSCVRNEDYVCRYGGEEMTIILNNTNNETAVNIAQKICNTISSKKYPLTPDLEVKITISLGCATYPKDGKTPAELIEYADKCLYNAKENGRNQVGSPNIKIS